MKKAILLSLVLASSALADPRPSPTPTPSRPPTYQELVDQVALLEYESITRDLQAINARLAAEDEGGAR